MLKQNRRTSYHERVVVPPQGLAGFLKKRGHIIRNWKRRYFVLEAGRLTYYQSAVEEGYTRTGTKLLGSMALTGVDMEVDKHVNAAWEDVGRVYISDVVTGVDLMLQIPADVIEMWMKGLQEHLEFACRCPLMVAGIPEATKSPWSFSQFSTCSPTNEVRHSLASRSESFDTVKSSHEGKSASSRSSSTSSATPDETSTDHARCDMPPSPTDKRMTNPKRLANITQIWYDSHRHRLMIN